jgi:hypothetical protein
VEARNNMNRQILTFLGLSIILVAAGMAAHAQQPVMSEKETLVMKFRKLTGADNVNLKINVSFDDTKAELVAMVDDDKELTDAQKPDLRKAAVEAYDRLDNQLKAFLNDRPQISRLSEIAVFKVYDQAFSEAELRELIAFYSTASGQKALKFLPTLSTQVQNEFQSMLIPKLQEFITPKSTAESDQLKQKIQETKMKKP